VLPERVDFPPRSAPSRTMSEIAAETTRKQTALMKRLARMREHKDFPEALQYVPPAEEDLERATREQRSGGLLALAGLALGALALTRGTAGLVLLGLLALAALVLGVRRWLRGRQRRVGVLALPLDRRPALVADRRSETTTGWLDGRTTYFFQLEFDDGSSGEFRYPGRGVQDDLLVKGVTGVAFLRGPTLIAWKNIKV
jgi:hypothetical protein